MNITVSSITGSSAIGYLTLGKVLRSITDEDLVAKVKVQV